MRWRFLLSILSLLVGEAAFSQHKVKLSRSFNEPVKEELKPFFSPSKGQLEDLFEGEVISEGKVTSPTEKEQQMMLFNSGIHPRTCKRAMRKLSMYEDYDKYMDFIKESKYDEKTKQFSFSIDNALLPFPMTVKFKIPRITKEGHYPFTFEDGMLKGLKGTIYLKDLGKHCLMGMKSDWRGPETKMPNIVFETFIQTIAKLGLQHMIRISLF